MGIGHLGGGGGGDTPNVGLHTLFLIPVVNRDQGNLGMEHELV